MTASSIDEESNSISPVSFNLEPQPRPAMAQPPHDGSTCNLAFWDLAHIFHTNNPPNPPEAAVLQREVDVLAPLVLGLRTQLREAEEGFLLCKTALSPIRRLPQEILGQIINFVLDTLKGKERHTSLIRFGQVCHSWDTAAHDPSHWAGETLVLSDTNSLHTAEAIEAWFKNAGDFPRTVTLQGDGCICGDPGRRKDWVSCDCDWRAAIASFIHRSTAIKRLVITQLSFRCFANLLASRGGKSIAQSEAWLLIQSMDLVLRSFGRTLKPTSFGVFDFFDLPPSLSFLSLNLPPLPANVTIGLVFNPHTLAHLTSLSVRCNWNTPDILRTLQHCRNLQSLFLDYDESPQSWNDDIQDAYLPSLRTLEIIMGKASASLRVLPYLVLPALSDLRLFVSLRHDDQELMRRLTQLKVLSPGDSPAPLLHSLTLRSSGSIVMGLKRKINAGVLLDILSSIPSLQHFTSDSIYFDAQRFVDALRKKTEGDILDILSRIRSVRLLDIDGDFYLFDIDAFLQFVIVRRRPSLNKCDLGAGRSTGALRAIVFGYSDWKLAEGHFFKFAKQQRQYEQASATIGLLQESYGVIVDRVFLSNRE